jgi:6-bladed beta-propeller
VVAVACGGEAPVESTEPRRPDLPQWRFADVPSLVIGVVEGDDAYQFFRASSAVRLSDQTIVVANNGTAQIRFFDPGGRFIRQVGRWGGGPGEFRWLQSVQATDGDTVVAFDGRLRRSHFAPDGVFVRSDNLPYQRETDFPGSVWLYKHAWVDGVHPGADRIVFARYIDRLPPPPVDAPFWYVRVDRERSLWISDGIESNGLRRHWTIYDTTGVAPRPELRGKRSRHHGTESHASERRHGAGAILLRPRAVRGAPEPTELGSA